MELIFSASHGGHRIRPGKAGRETETPTPAGTLMRCLLSARRVLLSRNIARYPLGDVHLDTG